MLKGLMDPDISTSGIPHLRSIDTFAFTDFGSDKLGLGYIIGPQDIILGEYRLGHFKKNKDQFIKTLKELIKKFIYLHDDSEYIEGHGEEFFKEVR